MSHDAKPPSPGRRKLLGAAAATFAAAPFGMFGFPEKTIAMGSPAKQASSHGAAITPFQIHVPDADLADLRRRVEATR